MKQNLMQRGVTLILLSTFMASLMLSALAVFLDPVINDDAIYYLSVAKVFAHGEYIQAIRADVFYEWPFYAFCIGMLSQVSGLQVDMAAYILNAIFIAITVTVFVAASHELSQGDRRVVVVAALVFLLLPALNAYRSFIIRDFGYFACYSVGFYALLQYVNTRYYRYALLWGSVSILAILFRSEGIVFLVLAPLYLLFTDKPFSRASWHSYIKANSVILAAMLIAGLMAGYLVLAYESTQLSGLIVRHVNNALLVFGSANELLEKYADKLGAALLFHYNQGELKFISLVIIVAILVMEFIKLLSLPYIVLLLTAVRRKWFAALPGMFGLWRVFIGINIAILLVFVFANLFLVGRYAMALLMTFMLCMPFLLIRFYTDIWKARLNPVIRAGVAILCVLFVYNILDGIISTGPTRDYEKRAGLWLRNEMKAADTLFSSDPTVAYYANAIDLSQYANDPHSALQDVREYSLDEASELLREETLTKYDFVALRFRPRKNEVIANIEGVEWLHRLKVFENNRGDQVVIYRIKS